MSENDPDYDPIVLVCVDINFVFSPSGHVQSYDRITSMQLRPLAWISNDETLLNVAKILLLNAVPICMLLQELKVLARVGALSWLKRGWSWFLVTSTRSHELAE